MEEEKPILSIGDRVRITRDTEKIVYIVQKVKKCDTIKNGSSFKYTLFDEINNDTVKTRLLHLDFKIVKLVIVFI